VIAMAAWRLYLTDQPVRRLDLLTGKPAVLAAWTGARRVSFFDVKNGARLGERVYDALLPAEREGETWQEFLRPFKAPNDSALPLLQLDGATLYNSADGQMQVIHDENGDLFLVSAGKAVRLHKEAEATFDVVAFDRTSGLIAVLDRAGRLHLYEQHTRLAIVETGLAGADEWRPALAVAQGGASIIASNGETVVITDGSGRLRQRLDLHYRRSALASSPDGQKLALADAEVGVIRVYDTSSLTATHQRFAADLLADARRVQLIGGTVSLSSSVHSLAINNRGTLAFAISGVICVTSVSRMGVLPRVSPKSR